MSSGAFTMRGTSLGLQPWFEPAFRGKVDVVIPVRNGARTILPTLTSVLAQTIPPRRIIVVDDGSTDDTVNIVTNLGSKLIELVRTPPVNASHARNTGIQASQAEFLAFLDADDRWHPDKLRRQMEVFARDPDATVVYCGYALLHPSGTVIEVQLPSLRGFVFNKLLAGRFAGNSSSIVARRDALLHIGGYDEQLSYAEDTDLHLRLAHRYKFNFAEGILTYVIANPDSLTRRPASLEAQEEFLRQNISMYEQWCPRNRMPHRVAQNLRKRIVYLAVRRQSGWRRMLRSKAALQASAPNSMRQIWPNHPMFACWIALGTLGYASRLLARPIKLAMASVSRRGRPQIWDSQKQASVEHAS
jgi:glycosyltransferase involved in cell wall biosynthesis